MTWTSPGGCWHWCAKVVSCTHSMWAGIELWGIAWNNADFLSIGLLEKNFGILILSYQTSTLSKWIHVISISILSRNVYCSHITRVVQLPGASIVHSYPPVTSPTPPTPFHFTPQRPNPPGTIPPPPHHTTHSPHHTTTHHTTPHHTPAHCLSFDLSPLCPLPHPFLALSYITPYRTALKRNTNCKLNVTSNLNYLHCMRATFTATRTSCGTTNILMTALTTPQPVMWLPTYTVCMT